MMQMTLKAAAVALLAGSALVSPGPALAAPDLNAVIKACTAGKLSFEQRAASLQKLGFKPLKNKSKLWVQGQLAHIAMDELTTATAAAPADLPGTYRRFDQMRRAGDLFRSDAQTLHLTNAARDVEISYALVDGEHSCSIAYGIGATDLPVTLRAKKQWKAGASQFLEYRAPAGRHATGSQLGPEWDKWIAGKRLVGGFFLVGQD